MTTRLDGSDFMDEALLTAFDCAIEERTEVDLKHEGLVYLGCLIVKVDRENRMLIVHTTRDHSLSFDGVEDYYFHV